MPKQRSISQLILAFLLVAAFYSTALQGQTIDKSVYVQFESTSISIMLPQGFTPSNNKDRWEGENASIQLEVIRGTAYTPRSDTFIIRPTNWKSLSAWKLDTIDQWSAI